MLRYLLPACLLILLAGCAATPSAPVTTEPTRVVGTIRYVQDQALLQTTLQLEAVAETDDAIPTLLGAEMRAPAEGGSGLFTDRRKMAYPPKVDMTVPCGGDACLLSIPLAMAAIDSIPTSMSRAEAQRLRIGQAPLREGESIVFFFEPVAGGAPRRLQFMGPTTSAVLGLPAESFADVPAGDYNIYLVRQGVVKDSTAALVHKIQTEYFTRPQPIMVAD